MSTPDVSQLLPPAPISTPLLNDKGLVGPQWTLYFQKLNARVGGGSSDNLTTVITNLSAAQGQITTQQGQIAELQATEAAHTSQIAALQASLTAQSFQIASLQAILSSGIAATYATAKLTTGGANGSLTFNSGLLTAETPAS